MFNLGSLLDTRVAFLCDGGLPNGEWIQAEGYVRGGYLEPHDGYRPRPILVLELSAPAGMRGKLKTAPLDTCSLIR